MKTVRLSRVVAACGKPTVYLMLIAPDKDTALMRSVKQSRGMTLHQASRGAKKKITARSASCAPRRASPRVSEIFEAIRETPNKPFRTVFAFNPPANAKPLLTAPAPSRTPVNL